MKILLFCAVFNTNAMLRRFYATATYIQTRSFGDIGKGVYAKPTEDAVFKYLMQDDEIRNSFLSGIIGRNVTWSKLTDASLNPIRSFVDIRKFLSSTKTKKLIQTYKEREEEIFPPQNPDATEFLKQFAEHYERLIQAIPKIERNTQLDLVCKTDNEIINVEIQVCKQEAWDLRILHHVCGLFNKQFYKGFAWNELEKKQDIGQIIKKVIGVSILESPPTQPKKVSLDWYNVTPWQPNELRRHFKLLDTTDNTKERSGIEFFDYNLSAFNNLAKDALKKETTLRDWLDFLANAHKKTTQDIKQNTQLLKPIKKAYQTIIGNNLPDDVSQAFMKQQEKENTAREKGIEEGIKKGKEEGIEEAIQNMLNAKLPPEQISKILKMPIEKIKEIESNFKK